MIGPRPGDGRVAAIAGLVAPVLALVGRVTLLRGLGPELAFVTFYPAVAAAAWAGGLRGGALATLVSAILAGVYVMAPAGEPTVDDALGLLAFVASGLIIAALGGGLHSALAASERARERATFLAQASGILNGQLARIDTIEALVDVAVPTLADWCAVDLVDERGAFSALRIAHPDPEKVALGYRLREEYPLDPASPTGVAAIVRTGEPEVQLVLQDYGPRIPDPRLREIMVGLQLRSYLGVPLVTPGGRVLGALSLFMSDSGRRFTRDDVETALDLGRRAGVAMDHAALFERVTAQRDELDAVTKVLADGVVVADGSGRIRTLNPAAEALLGRAGVDELDDILRRLDPVDGRPGLAHVPSTGRFVIPQLIGDGVAAGRSRIAILRDVTEVLETESARDAFVGMLSHELRTPITTIYGSAQVLRGPVAPEVRDGLIGDIADEANRLYRLVEDLLVLSRFERGRLDVAPEPVLVQRVVASVLGREGERHPGIRIDVRTADGVPAAMADPTYVEQITRNLLSNAAKYAGPTATVTVRISEEADRVKLEFEDDGPGIAPADQDRVFALYERLETGRVAPGAGIGLFVCRQLAEAMGGSMVVRRSDGGGACFVVTLPASDGRWASDTEDLTGAPATSSPRGG